jgi:integrase
MNINDLVTRYVAFRRAMGERFTKEATLRSFCRAVGPRLHVRGIRADAVAAFLAGSGPITRAWHSRYYALKGLFRFAVSRGHLDALPLPTELPKPGRPFVPYIYSRDEIGRLLQAGAAERRYPGWIEPPTLRAIIVLLYGTGLRDGEALRLSVADVDLPEALLTIRDTKFSKSRLVPIGRHLRQVLSDYLDWRQAAHPGAAAQSPLFLYRNGTAIRPGRLQEVFRRLRKDAGVKRSDNASHEPRLHDLRHTFAVHRPTEWYRQGADVQRLVHHLSVYLGHTHLRDTTVYLTMTPDLLRQANARFEQYASREGHHA